MTDQQADWASKGIDITQPSIARAYDVVLNGKDNFEVDRAFVAEIVKVVPEIYDVATYNRQILGRAVRFMAEQGVRQFIDLGSGLPTVQNTHHVAQRTAPGAHVVYVDNDRCKSGCAHTADSARIYDCFLVKGDDRGV